MTVTPPSSGRSRPDRRLVVVMGPGRSGTSTVAGALSKSGLAVPGPEVPADDTNPAGFFEPQWVVDFHTELLAKARVWTLDTSPDAADLVARVTRDQAVRRRLREWLAARLDEQPNLVLKDPRTLWFCDLWREVATDLGARPGFVTMLRHPAEVAGSRQQHYAKDDRADDRALGIHRIAGWVNGVLSAELITRDDPRVFIEYTDLLDDWRGELDRTAATLGLRLDPAPAVRPHPVDDFIDPGLRRAKVDWEQVDVPGPLRDLAERVWAAVSGLPGADDATSAASLDLLREEYLRMRQDAVVLSRPVITRAEAAGRRRGRRQLKAELEEKATSVTDARATPTAPSGPVDDSDTPGGLTAGVRAVRARLTGGKS